MAHVFYPSGSTTYIRTVSGSSLLEFHVSTNDYGFIFFLTGSSWETSSLTASYAISASYALSSTPAPPFGTGSTLPITASWAESSSYAIIALTASRVSSSGQHNYFVEWINGGLSTTSSIRDGSNSITIRDRSVYIYNNSGSLLQLQTWGPSAYDYSYIDLYRARGDSGAESAAQNGDIIGVLGFRGYGNNLYWPVAYVQVVAEENFSDSSTATSMRFATTNAGESSQVERWRITPSGSLMASGSQIIHSSGSSVRLIGTASYAVKAVNVDGFSLYLPTSPTPMKIVGHVDGTSDILQGNETWMDNVGNIRSDGTITSSFLGNLSGNVTGSISGTASYASTAGRIPVTTISPTGSAGATGSIIYDSAVDLLYIYTGTAWKSASFA